MSKLENLNITIIVSPALPHPVGRDTRSDSTYYKKGHWTQEEVFNFLYPKLVAKGHSATTYCGGRYSYRHL